MIEITKHTGLPCAFSFNRKNKNKLNLIVDKWKYLLYNNIVIKKLIENSRIIYYERE